MRLTVVSLLLLFSFAPALAQGQEKPQTKIILNSGEVITTPEAWDDSLYVWFNKDGKTVILNRSEVKSIERPYVITQGGETIAQIAARYNLPVADVAKWNGLGLPEDRPLPRGVTIRLTASGQTPVGFTEQKFEPSPLDELALVENNRGEAEGADAKCSIDNPATVKLRGLRVGMTVEEVHSYLPQATPPWADEFGYAEKIIAPFKFPQLARSPLWRDVSVIGLNFVDGKVCMVALWYRNVDHWTSGEQFTEQVARSLGIHGKWRQRRSDSTPLDQLWQIDCGGQTFRAGLHYSLGEYVPLVEWEDESAVNLMISRKVDKADRIRKEAERRRKAFKP